MEEKCQCSASDRQMLKEVKARMPKEEELFDVAELFKVFGDTTRTKIIHVLLEQEMCVYHIAHILNMSQSSVSHQLRTLKQARLVKFRKEGQMVYYSLDDEHIRDLFAIAYSHITERKDAYARA